jgi:transcriptional regulator with XRE-family HTH domain
MMQRKAAKKAAKPRANTPDDKEIGVRLRTIRIDHKMSQEQLGTSLGVSFQQVQKYERGTNRISASRIMQIAKILKTTPHELMGWDSGKLGDVMFDGESYKLAKAFSELPDATKTPFRALINAVIGKR